MSELIDVIHCLEIKLKQEAYLFFLIHLCTWVIFLWFKYNICEDYIYMNHEKGTYENYFDHLRAFLFLNIISF